MKDNVDEVKHKVISVRLRTWTLTLSIIVCLVFYFLVTLSTKQAINPIDFVFLCLVQILTHCLYFPDGDLYGQKDPAYISNKGSYNLSANKISQNKQMEKLRKYCKVEFEERKERYILNECSKIGITFAEFEILQQIEEDELKIIKSHTFQKVDGTTYKKIFPKKKRQRLYNLICHELPVEPNQPETIMSAVENNGNRAIRDGSVAYRRSTYIRKFLTAILLGGIFAYIGYTVRDGIGLAEIVNILMYLTTIFSTAVMSFSAGETCSKVHKSHFYVDLVNFIDGFNEWLIKQPAEEPEQLNKEFQESA